MVPEDTLMRPLPPLRELMARATRKAYINDLRAGAVFIDEIDLYKSAELLGGDDCVRQLIEWYKSTGGYIGPGHRYVAAKLMAGILKLWAIEE